MVVVAGAVAAAWLVLVGAAVLSRVVAGCSVGRSTLVVVLAYACLCAAAFGWLGWRWSGMLGAAGMLLPACVALVIVRLARPRAALRGRMSGS